MPELDIQGILEALYEEGVEFLIIGGVAVGFHGYVRGGNWILRTRLGRFDVMQWIGDDALWEKLSPTAIETEIGSLTVKIVSYDGLVALKEHAGRPEDLLDLQRLREARSEE